MMGMRSRKPWPEVNHASHSSCTKPKSLASPVKSSSSGASLAAAARIWCQVLALPRAGSILTPSWTGSSDGGRAGESEQQKAAAHASAAHNFFIRLVYHGWRDRLHPQEFEAGVGAAGLSQTSAREAASRPRSR